MGFVSYLDILAILPHSFMLNARYVYKLFEENILDVQNRYQCDSQMERKEAIFVVKYVR